jgi:hypothetical protein
MIFESDKEVFDFIREKKNYTECHEASVIQKQLRLLCFSECFDPELINDIWLKVITQEKRDVYQKIYKNHAKQLIQKIHKQLNRVFYASGGSVQLRFKNESQQELFSDKLNAINSKGLEKYMRSEHIYNLLSCPSSFYYLKNELSDYEDEGFELKRLSIERVKSIVIENDCVEAIAYQKESKNDFSEYYFVFDDTYRYQVQCKTEDNFVLVEKETHGFTKVPLVQIGTAKRFPENEIERLSPLQVVFEDLKEYNTYSTFDRFSKFDESFPKEIQSEVTNSAGVAQKQTNLNTGQHNGYSQAYPYQVITNSNYFSDTSISRNATKSLFGSKIQIPFQKTSDKDFMQTMRNAYFTVDANATLLTFRKTDLDDFKEWILEQVLGNGFGRADEAQQVKTATEVSASFVGQQNVLNNIRLECETVIVSIVSKFAEAFDEKNFESVFWDLGSIYFLKTAEQSISELGTLKSITSNAAVLAAKQNEITVYSTNANIDELTRYKLITKLQPYSQMSLAEVNTIRGYLVNFPFQLFLYDNFIQILSLFELKYGNIETFSKVTADSGFEKLQEKFYEFAVLFFQKMNNYTKQVIDGDVNSNQEV